MQSLAGQSFNKHVNQVETLIFLKLLMQGNGSTEAIVTNDIRRVNSACNRYKRNRNLCLQFYDFDFKDSRAGGRAMGILTNIVKNSFIRKQFSK